MISPDINAIREQVSLALIEDLGGELNAHNDITANLIDESENATATIITREQCVICGVAWVEQAFALIDEHLELVWQVKDGDTVAADTTLLTLTGSARAIQQRQPSQPATRSCLPEATPKFLIHAKPYQAFAWHRSTLCIVAADKIIVLVCLMRS